jgi:hypothetical protein
MRRGRTRSGTTQGATESLGNVRSFRGRVRPAAISPKLRIRRVAPVRLPEAFSSATPFADPLSKKGSSKKNALRGALCRRSSPSPGPPDAHFTAPGLTVPAPTVHLIPLCAVSLCAVSLCAVSLCGAPHEVRPLKKSALQGLLGTSSSASAWCPSWPSHNGRRALRSTKRAIHAGRKCRPSLFGT